MKKRRININSAVGIASLIMSTTSLVWIGGFQYSAITLEIRHMSERLDKMDARFDKIDNRLDRIETEINKLHVRVNILEHANRSGV